VGVGYTLINLDKKEEISFLHIKASKMRELANTIASASITTWYLLNNRGDRIAFISDHETEHLLFGQTYHYTEFIGYLDVTNTVVEQLIETGVLYDAGILWMDEDDSNLFVRDLRSTSNIRGQNS
jgi:hypothetical protein